MRKPARKLLRSIARLRSTLQVCRDRLGSHDVVLDRALANAKFVEAERVLSWVARTLEGLSGL